MKILKYKKIFLSISAVLVLAAISSIFYFGFNLGIDFKGGSIYEISYTKKITEADVKKAIKNAAIQTSIVQRLGENNFVIKTNTLTDEKKLLLDKELAKNGDYQKIQYKSISPSISTEFINKSIAAIILVVITIILFISYVFRAVSRPISSWKYGLVAIIALIHDVIIPAGIFAVLGSIFVNYQIDVLFVTAILAILGYSVNDTIVVFDRIRENLKTAGKKIKGKEFEKVVGVSLEQTIRRSLFTSITTLIVIGFLYFLGGENTKVFALVLGIGVIAGTYSSIFIASPLLTYIEKYWQSPEKKDRSEMTEDELVEELTKL